MNTKRPASLLALQRAQRAHLFPADLLHARHAVLHPTHVHHAMREIDLIPSQRAQLADAEPVPERDQDHGRIAQPVAPLALLGRRDQPLDLLRRQVLARPQRRDSRLRRGGTVPFRRVGRVRRLVFLALFFMVSDIPHCPIKGHLWDS